MMNSAVLSEIEAKIDRLSHEEQLWLIERLAHRLRKREEKNQKVLESQLAAMASDPEIREELSTISKEFAITESDGLEKV